MRKLQDFLKESLINEASGKYKAFVVDPYMRQVNICTEYPTTDPYTNDEPLDIESTDWLYDDITGNKGNIIEVSWCDDRITGFMVDARDEREIEKEFIKAAEDWIKENEDWFDSDYVEIYFTLPCGLYFSGDWDIHDDGNKKPSGKDLYEKWLAQYNDSQVDGDSAYCKCLIDLKKKKVIAGGADVRFWF